MVAASKIVALIPARGGSKSLPRKNIRPLAGHPLLAYSIAAGLQATMIDRVIVSTDDPEIAERARAYGAEAPSLRPANYSQDDTLDLPVFEHALDWLSKHEGYEPEVLVQLRPTSPLRPPGLVDEAISILMGDSAADSVRGVAPSGQNPYKMWRIDSSNHLQPLLEYKKKEAYNLPRQSLPDTFWQTGHIDVIRASTILTKKSMSGEVILPVAIDPAYAVDIDTIVQWAYAEAILESDQLPVSRPDKVGRRLPDEPSLVVLDFDGVLTDNRVWVDANGREEVAAHRGDGWGIQRLKASGVEVVVLSTESNPVVEARCKKLGIACWQGIADKGQAMQQIIAEFKAEPATTIFVANDENDLPAFAYAGCNVVVADAHPSVLGRADVILRSPGGHGAVRELCDKLLSAANSMGDSDPSGMTANDQERPLEETA